MSETSAPFRWAIWRDDIVRPPAEQIALDDRLVEQVALGERPATARLWRSADCIVCPPSYRAAWRAIAGDAGIETPLFRSTGGGVVALAAGVALWSFAWARPTEQAETIDLAYDVAAREIVAALAAHDVAADVVEISDAMCRGRYDVAIGGRKIAGLSQRRIARSVDGRRMAGLLVHAFILVDPDLDALAARCNVLADRLGVPGTERAALVSLAEIRGTAGTTLDLAARS